MDDPEYIPSLSQMVEYNVARRECRDIIEKGRDRTGVDQHTWEYEASRWPIVRSKLDQAIADRRKSGAPKKHLAKLAREAAELAAEFERVCAYRTPVAKRDPAAPATAEAVRRRVGRTKKRERLVEWLEEKYGGELITVSIKRLVDMAAREILRASERTMQRAVNDYNAKPHLKG